MTSRTPVANRQSPTRDRRALTGVLVAQAVALTGTRVSAIALPWFVLVSTGSATQMGVVAFCELAPYVVVKALTGPMVDRTGPRQVSIVADLVSAAAIALVPLLHALGALHFGVLLALVAVVGAFRGPGDSAKEVFVPVAAEAAGIPLERATGIAGTIERLASTVGPAIAGVVVAAFGAVNALALNAATFAVGAVIIATTVPRVRATDNDESDVGSYLQRLGEGGAFLRHDRLTREVIGMITVTNLLDAAMFAVLLPLWARESGHGPAAIGAVGTAFGIFAVAGSLTAAAIGHRLPRRITYLVGFFLCGAPRFAVLAFDLPLPAVLAVMGLAGAGAGFINPILGAMFYERVPRQLLGRVNALGDAIAWAGMPFGGLAGAAVVGAVGLAPALLVLGGAYLLATTLPGLRPEWKEMDAQRHRARASGGPVGDRPVSDPDDAPGGPVGVPGAGEPTAAPH